MTQNFKVIIGGVDVTTNVASYNLSVQANRMYSIAKIEIGNVPDPIEGEDVSVTAGDSSFAGFIYASKKTKANMFSLECRTYSAKLTEPFSSYTEATDDAVNSHDLCALYSSISGVPIVNGSSVISFGGSYSRKGTMLSALTNIANITGAEYWDDAGTIRISPNKPIDEDGEQISDRDIFDFVPVEMSIYNNGVGTVYIQNGGDMDSDIVSDNSIYAEIDECSGAFTLYPNPYGDIESAIGVSGLSDIEVERTENISLLDSDTVTLDGSIKSISRITLNGLVITDYDFLEKNNIVYFSSKIRGLVTVDYVAYAKKGYANISHTPIGRFITFDIFYLDQVMSYQGILKGECLTASSDGDMTCITPSEMAYNAGFDVWTTGGDPEFIFFNRSARIQKNVSSASGIYISVESVSLEKFAGGYRYRTRYPVAVEYGARSSNADIPFTVTSDAGDFYFVFSEFYPNVEVSYGMNAVKHHVEFPVIPKSVVSMVIMNRNTEQICEYSLKTDIPCELNQSIVVHASREIGVNVVDVYNKSMELTKPDGTKETVMGDAFGDVFVYVDMDGEYKIDTSSVKQRSGIDFIANTKGLL